MSGGKGVADREITIQSPALADIAMDVCTPTQFESIASALVDCLQTSWTENFKTALVCASLHDVVSGNEAVMKQMWRQAFYSFLCESEGWPEWERNQWIEAIGDAIRAAGFSPKEVLGEELSVPCPRRMAIPSSLSMLKTYAPPISLGPLGVSLSVICRNLFLEFGKFCGSGQGEQVLMDLESACNRYLVQVSMLEEFLRQNLIDDNQKIHDSLLESEVRFALLCL